MVYRRFVDKRRPMVYPPNQTVTANEGEPLDVIVEFCAEPSYTRVFWMSEQQVYVPGGPSRDGIQALGIENGGTETCYRAILRFETIQWSHAGEWLLLVRSSKGIADASVLLNPRPPPFDGSSDSPSLPDLGHYTTAASTLNHTVVRIFGKSFEGDESGERVVERADNEGMRGRVEEKEYKSSTASRGRENVQSFDVDFDNVARIKTINKMKKVGKARKYSTTWKQD
ncbi:irregular chiasm C-roughest protein isoform X1 [Vespula maculifrons]|uniref:Irregular chiasm C-roughest protein isoform X1 n=1 Tax=Vespula maculifrons TaxID=7453 RepID=A0ABD2CS60_VESMC